MAKHHRTVPHGSTALAMVTAATLLSTNLNPAHAATIFWDGIGGNDLWGNAGNWSAAIPDSDDLAHFDDFMDPSLTPIVDLNGDRTVQSITIVSSRPFTLNNNTLSLTTGNINANDDGPATHTINSNVEIQADGLWTVQTDTTLVVEGNVSESGGARSLTKDGSGVLLLGGNNSYTGATNINAGILRMGAFSDSIPGSSLVNIAAGATLDMDVQPEAMGTLSGSGSITMNGGGANLIFGHDDASDIFSGVISGTGVINKQGTGTQTLSGSNTYSGTTFISNGKLAISSNSNLGSSPLIDFNGGTLSVTTNADLTSRQFFTDSTNDAKIEVTTFNTFVNLLVGGPGITGAGGLVKSGAGVLNIQTANTYSGSTQVLGGVLDISGASERLPDGTTVSISPGAFLRFFGGFDETISGLSGEGNVQLTSSGTTLSVGHQNTTSSFGGNITGAGGLTKIGGGNLTLTGSNSYTGGTLVSGGFLLATTNSLPATTGVTNNSALVFDQDFDGTYAGVISGSGAVIKVGTGTVTFNQTNTYSNGTFLTTGSLAISSDAHLGASTGTVTFNGGALRAVGSSQVTLPATRGLVANGTDAVLESHLTGGAAFILEGPVTGSGGLTIGGTGSIALFAPSTYLGDTTVQDGSVLVLQASGLNEWLPNTTDLNLEGAGVAFLFQDHTETIDALNGPAGSRVSFEFGTNSHLIVGASNGSGSFAGAITSAAGGDGRLTKIGNGTQTLSGINTYTGDTNINQGTLRIQNNATNSLPDATFVGVSSGATLELNSTAESVDSVSSASNGTVKFTGTGSALTILGNTYGSVFDGSFTGTGTVNKQGVQMEIRGGSDFSNGTFNVQDGLLILDTGLSSFIVNKFTVASSGTFNHDSGALIIAGDGGSFEPDANQNYTVQGKNADDWSALVIEKGASWSHNQIVTIGDNQEGDLRVRDVGTGLPTSVIINNKMLIGANAGSEGSDVVISGGDASLTLTELDVGGNGSSAGAPVVLTIHNLGNLNVTDARTKIWDNSVINVLSGNFTTKGLDFTAAGATLSHNGGAVRIENGLFSPPTGAYAVRGSNNPNLEFGAGGEWLHTSNVSIGGASPGTLNIEGGQVTHDHSATVHSGGTLNFTGGEYFVAALNAGAAGAVLNHTGGLLQVLGGTLETPGLGHTISGPNSPHISLLYTADWDVGAGPLLIGGIDPGQLSIGGGDTASTTVGGTTTIAGNGTLSLSSGRLTTNGLDATAPGATLEFLDGTIAVQNGAFRPAPDTPFVLNKSGFPRLQIGFNGTWTHNHPITINNGTLNVVSFSTGSPAVVRANDGLIINPTAEDGTTGPERVQVAGEGAHLIATTLEVGGDGAPSATDTVLSIRSNGTVTVTDAPTKVWDNGEIRIGEGGEPGFLTTPGLDLTAPGSRLGIEDGTVTINAGTLDLPPDQPFSLSGNDPGRARLVIAGTGSWTHANNVTIDGSATLSVQGTTVHTQGQAVLGATGDFSGTANVSGPTGSWTIDDDLVIALGEFAAGGLTVEGGGQVPVAGNTSIAEGTSSFGFLTVTGDGSNLTTTQLDVGGNGVANQKGNDGTLTINPGASVDVTTDRTKVWADGTIDVTGGDPFLPGGVLNTQGLELNGSGATLNHSGGTVRITGTGSQFLPDPSNTYSITGADTPALHIEDGASWTHDIFISVGFTSGPGILNVLDTDPHPGTPTSVVINGTLLIGHWADADGSSVTVSGEDASLQANQIQLGDDQVDGPSGTLNIENGATVTVTQQAVDVAQESQLQINDGTLTAPGVTLAPDALLTLTGGGTLNVPSTADVTGNSGTFAWGSGTINLTGNADIGSTLLPAFTSISDNQTLSVGGTLTVGATRALTVAGTGDLTTQNVQLNGGTLIAPTLTIGDPGLGNQLVGNLLVTGQNGAGARAGGLTGHGTLLADIAHDGIALSAEITATGPLTLGNAASTTGFNYSGILNVGTHRVTLLDANHATLGLMTNMSSGGSLNAINGATLPDGNFLNVTGPATIEGNFNNAGTVNGPASMGDLLTFDDDVKGVGNFAGNIELLQGYNPGNNDPGDNAAQVSFEGNLKLGNNTVFTVDITDPTNGSTPDPEPGVDHDQINLTGTGTFFPDGTFSIALLEGYNPSLGDTFTVATYLTRSGTFDTLENAVLNPDGSKSLAVVFDDVLGQLRVTAAIPGDANLDGQVSIGDLSLLASNFNESPGLGSWRKGDFNHDGQITIGDLSLLASNFGETNATIGNSLTTGGISLELAASFAGIDMSTVPEPHSITLFSVGAILVMRRRHNILVIGAG